MESFSAKTAILADGAFPVGAAPLDALQHADKIVCCDGAADKLIAAGMEPSWIVGDLDSVTAGTRARYGKRLVRVAEQATNDLSKAFRFCVKQGWRDIVILGATGLREDHTLSNLSLLVDFGREASVFMLTDTGWFTPVLQSTQFPSCLGQQVSIFSFDPQVKVYSEGLKYSLEGVLFTRWWQAALNEATGDTFKLVFEGGPLLVYQTFQ
ncbi:MAG: thiamine diphosphokinase [Kiritimatiellae bacterium]|nr:thiamine diphosphokinase [Kiritimatiellia bacterium]